jgi:hypothetical protein
MRYNFLKFILGFIIPISLALTSCSDDDETFSSLTGLTEFGFLANENVPGIENIVFSIDQTTGVITNTDELTFGSDVSDLIAEFTAIELTTVTVGGQPFVSGETVLDYTNDVTITVTAEDGKTTSVYTVVVNVSDVNPDAVTWAKRSSSITDFNYESVKAVYFNGKYRAIFGYANPKDMTTATKYMTSDDGITWTEETIDEESFPVGTKHSLAVFNDKMYICGHIVYSSGWGGSLASSQTIWESADGVTFTKMSSSFEWGYPPQRVEPYLYNFQNQLWAIGGQNVLANNWNGGWGPDSPLQGPQQLVDLISSTNDGNSWDDPFSRKLPKGKEGENMTPWGKPEDAARRYAASVVHNGKMYMIGGQVSGGYLSDLLWTSEDGETWDWIKPTGLTPRMGAAALSYNGKLWLIGGQTGLGECTNEILVSEDDGATWNPVGDEIALPENFEARAGHSVVVDDDGQIWIIGGYQATKKTIVEDGEELEREDTPIMLKDAWSGKIANILE